MVNSHTRTMYKNTLKIRHYTNIPYIYDYEYGALYSCEKNLPILPIPLSFFSDSFSISIQVFQSGRLQTHTMEGNCSI